MNHYHLPYEHRVFSQHGEDGIIQQMVSAIIDPNRFVFEIGWGNGTQNMSRNLITQGWRGIGIDGAHDIDPEVNLPRDFVFRSMMVTPDSFVDAVAGIPQTPDFFSLDIDSFDFEVAQWLLDQGFRPKTVCLEFNHRFGPTIEASFPYVPAPSDRKRGFYNKTMFHGVSLAKYRSLWQYHGYRYFGFDSSAVNVFFYDPKSVKSLDHLPLNNVDLLPTQQDLVRECVFANDFWADKIDQIYVLAQRRM